MEPCGTHARSDAYSTDGRVAAWIADDRLTRTDASGRQPSHHGTDWAGGGLWMCRTTFAPERRREFAPDSSLERAGFELLVPRRIGIALRLSKREPLRDDDFPQGVTSHRLAILADPPQESGPPPNRCPGTEGAVDDGDQRPDLPLARGRGQITVCLSSRLRCSSRR
jgi:hypothetical protein